MEPLVSPPSSSPAVPGTIRPLCLALAAPAICAFRCTLPPVTTIYSLLRLTDRSLTLLGKNCPSLQHLEVARCRNVTNGGVLELVTRCTELLHLDLTGCRPNTDAYLLNFHESCSYV